MWQRVAYTESYAENNSETSCCLFSCDPQVRETGAFTGGEGDFLDFKTVLVELDEVRIICAVCRILFCCFVFRAVA